LTPIDQGARAERARAHTPHVRARGCQPATIETPRPRTFINCRGRSPGSRVPALVRPSRDLAIPVTRIGQALAAHSCGGSSGLALRRKGLTGFPLSSRQNAPREPRRLHLVGDSYFSRKRSRDVCLRCTSHPRLFYNTPERMLTLAEASQAIHCAWTRYGHRWALHRFCGGCHRPTSLPWDWDPRGWWSTCCYSPACTCSFRPMRGNGATGAE
jgi:hypothetical protein